MLVCESSLPLRQSSWNVGYLDRICARKFLVKFEQVSAPSLLLRVDTAWRVPLACTFRNPCDREWDVLWFLQRVACLMFEELGDPMSRSWFRKGGTYGRRNQPPLIQPVLHSLHPRILFLQNHIISSTHSKLENIRNPQLTIQNTQAERRQSLHSSITEIFYVI